MKRVSANAPASPSATPAERDDHPVAHDQHQDAPRRRAERQPDAQLARALADEVGHDAVDADRGQPQRQRRRTASAAASKSAAAPATRPRAAPSSARCRSADPDRARAVPCGRPPSGRRDRRGCAARRSSPATGYCVCGKYIAIRESASSVYCFTRPTTPTTVSQGASARRSPVRMRLPTASSSGQSCCAMNSSTITTRGAVPRVVLVEEAPAQQRDLHRLEVVAGDDALVGVDEGFARLEACGLRP